MTVMVTMACSIGAAYAQPVSAATLSTPLEKSAIKYVEFRGDLGLIEGSTIDSESAMRDAHMRLASHDPDALSSGWVAYAALVAADTPEFAKAIQESVATPEAKTAFLARMRMEPRSIRELPGADKAIEAVMMMAARDATKINSLGQSFIDRAYSMQNAAWAKKKLSEGMSRVYEARDYAATRERAGTPVLPAYVSAGVQLPALAQTTDREWQATWSNEEAVPQINPRATPIIDRVLVLAVRYSVGEVTDPVVDGYAKSDQSRRCLNMAMLNFDQCIAATRTAYEEAFCIGEHGLNDVSGCLGWVAGAGEADD
ncbi:hypothetical protein [Aquisalinus flavus]|nr:hypothetical protein [Aquisalinus flavus]MBD0426273.1 hypothetical protein [Aquisalinus flavus]UNE48156.1 hypothetical protein FF099_08890 [Aquisalinus flavus]